MMRMGLIGAFTVLTVRSVIVAEVPLQIANSWSDYDAFMKLTAPQRRTRFDTMTGENKAMIVETHIKRWLQNNRGRLTAAEIGVFEEIISFVTPGLYRKRPDDTLAKREAALQAKMKCRINPDDVREATNVVAEVGESPRPKMKWSYVSQVRCWIDWVIEGLVDYAPNTRW